MHYRQNLLLATLVQDADSFLPLAENCLHAAARLSFEDEGSITFLLEPAVNFVYIFLLSGPDLFGLIMVKYCLAGAE